MEFEIEPFKFKPQKSELKKIKIVPTKEKLTAAAGLGTIMEIFDQSGLRDKFTLKKKTQSIEFRILKAYIF